MRRHFNSKRFWLIVALLAVLEVAAIFLINQWHHIFPSSEVSELYTKYAGREGMDASFIKNYRVNDTICMDVTLLQAHDTCVWDSLCVDFGIVPVSKFPQEFREQITLENSFFQRIITDTIVTEHDSIYNKCLVIFSHLDMSMCIFSDIDDSKYDAIVQKKHAEITL